MYNWDFSWVWTYRVGLLDALAVTLEINVVVLLLGSVLGILIAMLRGTRSRVLRAFALIYVDLFRALPVLVLLIWFFFCVPCGFRSKWGSDSVTKRGAIPLEVGRDSAGKRGSYRAINGTVPHLAESCPSRSGTAPHISGIGVPEVVGDAG